MSTGYEDWRRLTYVQEQSAALYFADIFRSLSQSPVVTDMRLIETGKTWYCWEKLTVQDPGRMFVFGTITILGD
ncbi:hypothetical protein DRO69_10850 [Candidatus Bathyarchaeota archaeon]|nr:MAG: hypothetical protein DRO69_10850 [Candidatus Bathyarchaeota archaeon]